MTALYRGYDAEGLAWQYSPRLSVKEGPALMEGWTRDAAAFRHQAGGTLDIAYGPRPEEKLDLFRPAGGSGARPPLHLFIHGGYWQRFYKEDFSHVAGGLLAHGVAVAVASYTLCPEVTIGEIVDQMRRCAAFLWREAGRLEVAVDRFQVSGHSAGGHLTAALVATDWPALGAGLPADLVKSAIPISGVFEVEPLRHTDIGKPLHLDDADAARQVSPLLWEPRSRGPLLLAVGGDESAEFHRQSAALAERWGAAGVPAETLSLPGRNHYTVLEELAAPDGALTRRALSLLGHPAR
ncbi:MAG: alpha/beta hydrolase [Dongiaceae bacterium]